ncbi:MAG: family 43 glycosylhydrolase [Bacillota bacterium]
MTQPVECRYAPPGEYIKDHSFVFHDGWWHLFSISGTEGYYHGYNGNEETVSWSISKDLVNWEMRGHVLHASQRKGAFDQHEVWAPFCLKANGRFYFFYTGVVHPSRPMEYRKLGHDHPWIHEGHRETQGLAVSEDLTDWVKVADTAAGLGIPGRDSHVVRDEANNRWLLYSTGGNNEAYVSRSADLLNWEFIGVCAKFPRILSENGKRFGKTTLDMNHGDFTHANLTESLTVMKHPLNGRWIMIGNWQYVISDDPLNFMDGEVKPHAVEYNGAAADIGFAGEMLEWRGKWYRSGVIGKRDYWKLGFTEVRWVKDGAFEVARPSENQLNS